MLTLLSSFAESLRSNSLSEDAAQAKLSDIARSLMSEYELVSPHGRWRITAAELYLYHRSWPDPFCHKNDAQLDVGRWYVHDNGTRAPTYSGFDITCGSREGDLYGGLLIRELDREKRWVFQRVMRGDKRMPFQRKGNVWLPEEKEVIGRIDRSLILDSKSIVRLEKTSKLPVVDLWIGPRIGLQVKRHGPVDQKYKRQALRIATWKTEVHKESMTKVE